MVDVSLGGFLAAISGVIQAALLMAAICWLAVQGLERLGASTVVQFVVVVLIGVATYALATLWRNRVVVDDLKSLRSPSP